MSLSLREEQGAGSANKYATLQMAVRNSYNSLIAVLIFSKQVTADEVIAHGNKVMTEIEFEKE